MKRIIREMILGYVFWCLFSALAPMIWFYPLNQLEISGYEAFAVFLFSPMFLGIARVRELLESSSGLGLLRCLSLASLTSFQAPDTLTRLVILASGCFCVMLVFTISLYADKEYRTLTLWGHILGLLAFLVSRIWFTTFVPAWWTASSNSAVIAIGAIATVDKILFDERVTNQSSKSITVNGNPTNLRKKSDAMNSGSKSSDTTNSSEKSSDTTNSSEKSSDTTNSSEKSSDTTNSSEKSSDTTHSSSKSPPSDTTNSSSKSSATTKSSEKSQPSDVSSQSNNSTSTDKQETLISSVSQSPDIPQPIWVLIAMGFGSWLFLIHWVFGEVSVVTRWSVKGFPNTGPMPYPWSLTILIGLWFGVELSPCRNVTGSVIWWMIGTSSFVALYQFDTWISFCGGVMLSVYTMSILPILVDRLTRCPPVCSICLALLTWIFEMLFLVWTVAYNFVPGGEYTREHSDWLVGVIMIALGAATLTRRSHPSSSHKPFPALSDSAMPCRKTRTVLILLVLLGVGGYISRYQKQSFKHPDKVHPGADFTASVWTYHFGYDNQGWPSMEQAAILLNETGSDVITLLESDASKPFLGNNDLALWLGERLSMYVDFGPSTKDHTWGNLILSKYPFVKSAHHLLPSPHGELAPAVSATVNMSGHLVDFVVTHMGNYRDAVDRDLQAKYLARKLKIAKNPVVFLGYITSQPKSRDYKRLIKKGKVKDIDSSDMERWCEYIMYRGLTRLGYARISHGGLSDTELQVARFRIPQDPQNYRDHDKIIVSPDKINKSTRFSKKFGKFHSGHNWEEVHRYHMNTPKYFVPDH